MPSQSARSSEARVSGRRSTYLEYFSANGGLAVAILSALSIPALGLIAWWLVRAVREGIDNHVWGALFFGVIAIGAVICAIMFFHAMLGRANITSECPSCGVRGARLFSPKNDYATECGHCSAYLRADGYVICEESKNAIADYPFYRIYEKMIDKHEGSFMIPNRCAVCCEPASRSNAVTSFSFDRAGRAPETNQKLDGLKFPLCSQDHGAAEEYAVADYARDLGFVSYRYYKLFCRENNLFTKTAKGPETTLEIAARKVMLEVLCCPGCGAPVPLGDGASIQCPYCGTGIAIPEEYRALRDAEHEAASGRVEAQALFKRLGRPPGILVRMWGGISIGVVYIVLWPFAFVFDGIFLVRALEWLSRSLHANLTEVLTNAHFFTLVGVAMYVTLGVPLVLGVYGRRRTDARRLLQTALAALPPSRPGGASRCRKCGAPLDVARDALGQTCVYCGTDNLVAMPESWVGAVRSKAKSLGGAIEAAADEDRKMRARTRKSLRNQLLWLLLIFPPLYGFGVQLDNDEYRMPPSWQGAVAGERQFISTIRRDPKKLRQVIPPPLPVSPQRNAISFDASECADDGCLRSYLVALRYNEIVTITGGDFPESVKGIAIIYHTQADAFFGDDWREVGEHGILLANKSAEFRAPRSAWYMVEFICPGSRPGVRLEITAGIEAPAS